jgi:hypothetical protein
MPRSLIWRARDGSSFYGCQRLANRPESSSEVETARGLLKRQVLQTGTTRSRFGRSVLHPVNKIFVGFLLSSNLWHRSLINS